MMKIRYCALGIGIVYVLLGVLGLIPPLVSEYVGAASLIVGIGSGYLFNLFAVNLIHNLVWLGLGAWGIVSYSQSENAALRFNRIVGTIFAVLTVLGLIPLTNTLFGLMPLFGHNIWFHAITAIIAAYFGFMTKLPQVKEASATS